MPSNSFNNLLAKLDPINPATPVTNTVLLFNIPLTSNIFPSYLIQTKIPNNIY